jgi:hypothetical protein
MVLRHFYRRARRSERWGRGLLPIRVEKILEQDPEKSYPRCIDGRRACPREDCGGPWTYQELLHLARSPFRDYERRQALKILGRSFDPELFDRRRVNALLNSLARG